jgi:hypothetical protein
MVITSAHHAAQTFPPAGYFVVVTLAVILIVLIACMRNTGRRH